MVGSEYLQGVWHLGLLDREGVWIAKVSGTPIDYFLFVKSAFLPMECDATTGWTFGNRWSGWLARLEEPTGSKHL